MPARLSDNHKPAAGELSNMNLNEIADELPGRIFDVLLNDDNLLRKAVCLYAVQNCLKDLGAEIAENLAEKISRPGAGPLPASWSPDEIAAGVRRVLDKNPELKKQLDEVK